MRDCGDQQPRLPALGASPPPSPHSGTPRSPDARSEEHTSELQSQSNLVCRLLLEKKKKYTHLNIRDPPLNRISVTSRHSLRPRERRVWASLQLTCTPHVTLRVPDRAARLQLRTSS